MMLLAYSSKSPWNLLFVPILASSFVVFLCNATCLDRDPSRGQPGARLDGCLDGNVMRPFNSTWNIENCTECNCTQSGITCCSTLQVPVVLSGNCEVVVNRSACTYYIQKTSDKPELCNMYVLL
ncbi:beta-microseminoprotein isoform X2 [Xenopus laevis]|uniref:Beta-microseminoprotein n=2 Tax=Xenopus laevis TaxID=8355 RepID=A0A974CFU9_XENLA|nr:beta-microseminoprotein isoform X2 [Xenopus laevis]OCT71850.1 hypothetical protein XELAEV_18034827mg [Xenopus laevis]